MAHRSRKLTPKFLRRNQPRTSTIKRISSKKREKPQKKGWLSSSLVLVILLSSLGLVMAFAWFSILFMFNPEKIGWLNKFLPGWAQIPLGYSEPPQTLQQIKDKLSQQKQIPGTTLPLDDEDNSFLLPVFQQRANCQSDCKEVVELRVYQRSTDLEVQSQPEKYFRLAHYLPVTGPEEYEAIAPLNAVTSESHDSNITLPLNEVKRVEGDGESSGVWFDLRGHRQQGIYAIAYGEIVYYNPERNNLQQMLSWTSPTGQLPKWQQVTGGGAKELVIDQTVGLEPQLNVYQVKSVKLYLKPIQLEAISLKPPAFKDSAYQDALSIARSGLWTPAFQWLQSIQKQRKKTLPAAAQAQIDVIRLHAQLSKAQAEKTWASPGQQALAELIDGRWEKALQVFAASPENTQEIASLLKADTGRLWNRTVAALQVKPDRPEVQAWAALILASKHGQERANSWLKEQPKITQATLVYIQGLLKTLKGNVAKSQNSSKHPSLIVGGVQPISQVKFDEWLPANPKADIKLINNQVWYQVQVSAFHDGKRWLNAPFTNLSVPKNAPAKFLWETLGINSDPIIQITVWLANGEQQATTATIKGVQLQDGVLRLFAAGELISPSPSPSPRSLALTNNALEWVQPSPITLAELYQKDPRVVENMLPIVWRSLQQSGQLTNGEVPKFSQIQDQISDWPVQVIDLTNDNKPETVLTISPQAIASLKNLTLTNQDSDKTAYLSRTLILSDSGKVIYTDFQKNSQQALTAIAKILGDNSLALLVEDSNNYSLKRWSVKNQRFE
ncbi:hypothetical protein NIES4103_20500 [Nostoc sp. NIES-4103]|nr:hypothetical protein NIES4103_20500 [Nostoc sp. NIES-4103]